LINICNTPRANAAVMSGLESGVPSSIAWIFPRPRGGNKRPELRRRAPRSLAQEGLPSMRNTFFAAAGATALLAGCGIGAKYPDFAQSSYRIEGMTESANGGAAVHTVIYRDGPKMRVETVLPTRGQATIVFDQATNAAYVLNPVGQVPATPIAGAPTQGAAATQSTVASSATTTTNTTPAPRGVAVRINDADAPQPLETAWQALGAENARRVGDCSVAGEHGTEWRPREAPAPGVERTACITSDGIVLRVRENQRVLWQASALQRGPQQAALFGIPAGYQLIDPQAVAEQFGANMENLNGVTGGPAPQQQPTPAPPPG
jgi:hypothetical protein